MDCSGTHASRCSRRRQCSLGSSARRRSPPADLRNLRTIFYGGGPMYVADLERALQLFGPRLYQPFGQGE
jgi:hypothetical protein